MQKLAEAEAELHSPRIVMAKRQKKEQQAELPEALVEEILVRLPIKSLVKFKAVSKSWLSLISGHRFFAFRLHFATTKAQTFHDIPKYPYLVIRNLNHHRDKMLIAPVLVGPAPPRITIKDSCPENFINLMMGVNLQALCPIGFGVFCGFECRDGNALLWNPTTRETKVLPPSPFYSSCRVNVCHFGIMDCNARGNFFSYNVGRVTSETILTTQYNQRLGYQLRLSLELYSSETKSWKLLPNFYIGECLGYDALTLQWANLNGRVHWMIRSWHVTSFDYKTKVFTSIRAPSAPEFGGHYDRWRNNPIVTLFDDKFLCLLLNRYANNKRYVDIWVMREYGVEDSWTKVFTLGPILDTMEVLGFSSKAQCIFLRPIRGLPFRLAVCDCESSNIEWLPLTGVPQDQFIKIVEHVESVVSLPE